LNSLEADRPKERQERQEKIAQIESVRGSRVLVLMYLYASIEEEDDIPIFESLEKMGHVKKIDLILCSTGGDSDAAVKILKLIRTYCEELTAIVPYEASSAATLICLGADEIQMSPIAQLSPLDPLVKHPRKKTWIPALSIRNFFEFVEKTSTETYVPSELFKIFEGLDPWMIGTFERVIEESKESAKFLLSKYMLKNKDETEIDEIVEKLSEKYASHHYAIMREEAKNELGLNITFLDGEKLNPVWELYKSYKKLAEKSENDIKIFETTNYSYAEEEEEEEEEEE